ncbi:MAG: MutH/Sau3AI family endonuclease, partial [Deltaproteobacteria bacterium]
MEKGSDPFSEGLIAPPESEQELLSRAWEVAGLTLGELGARVDIEVPDESVRAKGIAGQILEKALGASAGSRAEPDFVKLGIELKTIPLDASGKPKESTFVCS